MSVKRIKDPAGLLPNHVMVDLTDPSPDDIQEAREMLEFGTPAARIDRLRRHGLLSMTADQLTGRLAELKGTMDARLKIQIVSAESRALYLDAAPAAIEQRNRIVAANKKRAVTDAQIDKALRDNKTQVDAAEVLGISTRQLRTRLKNRKR